MPRDLQRRIDAQLQERAPWLGFIVGCIFANDVVNDFGQLPWRLAVTLGVFAGALSVACIGAAVAARRATTISPWTRHIAGGLFILAVTHGVLRLHLTSNPWCFGGIAIVMAMAGLTLTTFVPFLITTAVGLAGTLPVVSRIVPDDSPDTYSTLILSALVGFMILLARRRSDRHLATAEWNEEQLTTDLRASVDRLRHEARERQASDSALQASEERCRSIIDNSVVGFFRCSSDGSVFLANETLSRMLGYASADAMIGASFADHWPTDSGGERAVATDRMFDSVRFDRSECLLNRRDGGVLTVAFDVRPLISPQGAVIGYEGLALDITARQAAEESLRLHREELTHVSRLAALGEMLAAIAHEVNQPLHAIANFAGASVKMLPNTEDEALSRVRHWNECIVEQATRAGEVIRRLRGFAAKHPPQQVLLNLRTVVEESLALVHPVLQQSGVEARIELEEHVSPILADQVLIEQVLTNLILNACEAMCAVPSGARVLTLRGEQQGNHVELTVTDTGTGVPVADSRRIFDAFVTTKPDGLGLGLAVSRSIVEAHGGRIWVDQDREAGATFHITLPIGKRLRKHVR